MQLLRRERSLLSTKFLTGIMLSMPLSLQDARSDSERAMTPDSMLLMTLFHLGQVLSLLGSTGVNTDRVRTPTLHG